MEKLFVPVDIALQLKELGFDEPCIGFYTNSGELKRHLKMEGDPDSFDVGLINSNINVDGYVTAPLYQQVVDWFRTAHNLFIELYRQTEENSYNYMITDIKYDRDISDSKLEGYTEYYDALNVSLNTCIKILKNEF